MASTVKLNEMKSLPIGKVIDELSSSYIELIKHNVPLSKFPSVMLWGQPGVGKSEGIDQICERIQAATGKKAVKTDVRLLLFNPIDLRGIPVADQDNDGEKVARWLKPLIFKMDPSKDVINILFLDEISAAPQSVQAAAYQITLDKRVGEHKLPDNCIVIAAGNRTSDKSVANKMPKALSNRLMHFDISSDFEGWKSWAIKNDIHPIVLGFLTFKPNLLNTFDSSNDALAFATPRSWAMVSNILKYVNDNIDKVYNQLAGLVGANIIIELRAWVMMYHALPAIKDVFDGKIKNIPNEPSCLFALSISIIQYAKEHTKDINRIMNAIDYVSSFPKDISSIIIEELLADEVGIRDTLMKTPEFTQWVNRQGLHITSIGNGIFR